MAAGAAGRRRRGRRLGRRRARRRRRPHRSGHHRRRTGHGVAGRRRDHRRDDPRRRGRRPRGAQHAGRARRRRTVEPSAELAAALDVGAARAAPAARHPTVDEYRRRPGSHRRHRAGHVVEPHRMAARRRPRPPGGRRRRPPRPGTAAPPVDHCRCSSPAPLRASSPCRSAISRRARSTACCSTAGTRPRQGPRPRPVWRSTTTRRARGPAVDPPRLPGQPGRGLVARRRRGRPSPRPPTSPRFAWSVRGAAAGALLPATYLADNTSGEVVSTNFTPIGVMVKMEQT